MHTKTIGALCAIIFGIVLVWPATGFAGIGQIKTLQGDVQILRDGKLVTAKLGDELKQSDTVKTAADGQVGIVFIDETRFSAGPKSTIELTQFRFDTAQRDRSTFDMKLKRGTLSIISGRIAKTRPDAMTVRTPATILGVRGTRFLVRAGE